MRGILFSCFGFCLRISCRIIWTEVLARTWVLYYASGTSGNDVELGFPFCLLVAVWVAYSEDMTTLSASCSENFPSSD